MKKFVASLWRGVKKNEPHATTPRKAKNKIKDRERNYQQDHKKGLSELR